MNPRREVSDYLSRVADEKEAYRDCTTIHDLPPIFHYWSNRHILPKLRPLGFCSPNQMFEKYLLEQCRRTPAARFASIGSGNCELEIDLAAHLRAAGHSHFVIDCIDLNPDMLTRGRSSAAAALLQPYLNFIEADFNTWAPQHAYDAVISNQALHHVSNLEGLFSQVKASLTDKGQFVISDMIGRNGHQRWPEALAIVQEFWRELPPSYRLNRKLQRYEERFEDWDCSHSGFEGIRSQDILPLLLSHFHFEVFLGFGNVIDPFIDRSFGPNFNVANASDRAFIDDVHRCDDEAISAGAITPTHMLAVVRKTPPENPVNAERSVRDPNASALLPYSVGPSYKWRAWPHSTQHELETACLRLAESERKAQALSQQVEYLERQHAEMAKQAAYLANHLNELRTHPIPNLAKAAARRLRRLL